MLLDDLIYVCLLLLCIAFGKFYRTVRCPRQRQWLGTCFGFCLVVCVSGKHVAHPLVATLVNALIITRLSNKVCHLYSFFFSFFYLLFVFRLSEWIGLPRPPGHANLIQMMLTLKLAGLAFEVNSAANPPNGDDNEGVNSDAMAKIGFTDVFHYAFNYCGVLTGPYYRYRTYWDSLHRPFAVQADHWSHTRTKLIQITCFTIIFLSSNLLFPAIYALSDDFAERSLIYRICYIYPTFVTFRMRMYVGMMMSECVCQMAGIGAYPVDCEPVSGLGPKNYRKAVTLSSDPDSLKRHELDFETVHNMNVWAVEKCFLVREAMKRWNTCVQYWMAVYVYKRFPHRGLRTMATLTLSALWHGYAPGYYLCICQITLYLPMEDIWVKFYKASPEGSTTKTALHCLLWFMRMSCMSYLGLSFQLLELNQSLTFYKRVYFLGHLLVLALYVIGRFIVRPYFKTSLPPAHDQQQKLIADDKKSS